MQSIHQVSKGTTPQGLKLKRLQQSAAKHVAQSEAHLRSLWQRAGMHVFSSQCTRRVKACRVCATVTRIISMQSEATNTHLILPGSTWTVQPHGQQSLLGQIHRQG